MEELGLRKKKVELGKFYRNSIHEMFDKEVKKAIKAENEKNNLGKAVSKEIKKKNK